MTDPGVPQLLDDLINADTSGYKLDTWEKRNQFDCLRAVVTFKTLAGVAGVFHLDECDVEGISGVGFDTGLPLSGSPAHGPTGGGGVASFADERGGVDIEPPGEIVL